MRVRILSRRCEPEQFTYFCPAVPVIPAVQIGPFHFSSLKQFLLHNMFAEQDPSFSRLFTQDYEAELRTEYTRVHAAKFGHTPMVDNESMCELMRQKESYLRWKQCADSPAATDLFARLDNRLRVRASDLMNTWIRTRFANVSFSGSFSSDEFTEYARLLTTFFHEQQVQAIYQQQSLAKTSKKLGTPKVQENVEHQVQDKNGRILDMLISNSSAERREAAVTINGIYCPSSPGVAHALTKILNLM